MIVDNIKRARANVERACARVGRAAEDVTIIAVTKTHGADVVNAVIDAGIRDIGENRIQEFLTKEPGVEHSCRWHLIGTLQSNKATKAIGKFEIFHAVDRMKIAETLSRLGTESDLTTRVLLEVNTSGEASKHGFAPEETPEAAARIGELPGLKLDGLMTLGPLTENQTAIRRSFQSLFRLREKIETSLGRPLDHLSMGMSNDFEIAVEEGATLIRLGRVLLGERQPR